MLYVDQLPSGYGRVTMRRYIRARTQCLLKRQRIQTQDQFRKSTLQSASSPVLDVSSRHVAESAAPGNLSPEPESSARVVADINSLVQRVAGVSLDQLDDVIVDLRELRDFLRSEGERIEREISGYLRLHEIAIGSTKRIVDNVAQWKEVAHSTARTLERRSAATERGDFLEPAPSPSSTGIKEVFIPAK